MTSRFANRCARETDRPVKILSDTRCDTPQTTMMKAVLLVAAAAVATEAVTNVAVLELGKRGSVRAVESSSPDTTLDGVVSFFTALHGGKAQHPGMSVVPDLFNKPDSSIVIGINGLKMDALQSIQTLQEDFAGIFELDGHRTDALMSKLQDVETVSLETLKEKAIELGTKQGMGAIFFGADSEGASALDETLTSTIAGLKNHAESTERSLLVHFVIEGNNDSARRMSRRLEQNENENQNAEDGQAYNPYYGYGYVNAYGDWVTPYKTMFQIQYFNVVLWTSIGLALALVYTIYLMVFMPLEADTLLFGESAKIVGDD